MNNPYRLLVWSQQVLNDQRSKENSYFIHSAKMTRFCIISMTLVALITLLAFIWLGWGPMSCWNEALAWENKEIPFLWNMPAIMLSVPATAFMLSVFLLFSQHQSSHGKMVLVGKAYLMLKQDEC